MFEKPLIESLVLTVDEVDKIFVNWRDIIACNDNFLRYRFIFLINIYNVNYGYSFNKHFSEHYVYDEIIAKEGL